MNKSRNLKPKKLTKQQAVIRALSDCIVEAQKPIRILDAVKWGDAIRDEFFAKKCRVLPKIDKDYYQKNKLGFKPEVLKDIFRHIDRDIQSQLGQFCTVGSMMQDRCREYIQAIELLEARGTSKFSFLSAELYGSTKDVFYPDGPRINDLALVLGHTLTRLNKMTLNDLDEKKYTSRQAANLLTKRLKKYFTEKADTISVQVSDTLVADAAAGADSIKLRRAAMFSDRDIRMLEVHEGWVHLGTTLNGIQQPICTFLGKGPPSASVMQEGLAVITEITAFASYPSRVKKITDRIEVINMAEDGANFMEVFQHLEKHGYSNELAYQLASRVFRGSSPKLGPFTKDLSYGKGFILIFNYLRLVVSEGLLDHVPALFVGKAKIENLQPLTELMQEGLVMPPCYIPPQFRDIAALSAWLSFSIFMNEIELDKFSESFQDILSPIYPKKS